MLRGVDHGSNQHIKSADNRFLGMEKFGFYGKTVNAELTKLYIVK